MLKKISDTLSNLGINKSDIILLFLNSDILKDKSISKKNHCDSILESIFSVIGESGLLVTPAFNYDFCKTGIFHPNKSPSQVGYFSNYLLRKKNVHRSLHPIFSFVGIGKNAKKMLSNVSNDAFGEDSIFDRLFHHGAKVVYMNLYNQNPDGPPCTVTHYIEQKFGVDYRYLKKFKGTIIDNNSSDFLYYVRDLSLNFITDNSKFFFQSLNRDIIKLGVVDYKYPISVCNMKDLVDFGLYSLHKDKYFMLEKPPKKIMSYQNSNVV